MRILKKPQERKKEFLNIARKFFFTKGYEQTSVDTIIKEIGLSKGSFYYYFKSKEDLLNELTKDLMSNILVEIKKIINRKDLTAVSKLNKAFAAIGMIKLANIELIKTLQKAFYDDKNLYFRYKVYQNSTNMLAPVFSQIIKQGLQEGNFFTPYPDEAARLFFELSFTIGERVPKLILEIDQHPENFCKIVEILDNYQFTIERIIGAKRGTIKIYSKNLIKKFLNKMKVYSKNNCDKPKKQII